MKNTLLCKCRALFATPSTKKNTTRFNGLLTLFIMVMGMGVSWGQIVTFDFAGATGSETTINSNTTNSNLGTCTISRGSGLNASANGDRFNGTGWAITSISNAVTGNNYMEFTITPNSGFQFSVTSIVIQLQRSATGLTSIALRNSLDSYASNLDAEKTIIDNTSTQTFTFTFTQTNSSTAVTYRLYGYAEAAGGTGGPGDGTGNDITVNGTVTPISTTWTASWSNGTPTSSLNAVIAGNLTTSTDLVCKDLTINSGNNLTIGAGKKLTVSGNLINNGTLVFKSDASNTALFDVFNGTQSGTGVVTVERYIPNNRAWRALTAPVIGSTNNSVFYNWQNNGTTISNTGVELWGPDGTGSSGNGLAVGPNSSILRYDGSWSPVTDTKSISLFTSSINNAFMIFPTGAYGSGNIASTTTAVATTLKATGKLITGNITYPGLSNISHTLIGNPYASPIDLNSILDANATLEKLFWVWDPNGGNQGTYNTFDATANAYTVTNLSYTNSTVIQSGQAFFVKALSGQTGSFTISENNKSTASTNTLFRNGTTPELLRVGLYKQVNNEWAGRDGAMTVLLSDAAANQSANKLANSTENIAFTKNGASFASNHHLPLVASDVLNVKVWNTTSGANYKLKINTEALTTTHLSATLEDLFTNSRTPLNLEGAAVEYPFTVTSDALSSGDRFRIVFQNVVLGTNNPTANGFQIVPNPVTGDSFQVNLGTLATGTYSYSICNAIGQEVEKGTLNNTTQNTNYEVKMSTVAKGIYVMKIKGSNNSVFTAKIIKK